MGTLENSTDHAIHKAAIDLQHGDIQSFREDMRSLRADPHYSANRLEEMKALGDALQHKGLLPQLAIGKDEQIVGISKNGHILTHKDGTAQLQWHGAGGEHRHMAGRAAQTDQAGEQTHLTSRPAHTASAEHQPALKPADQAADHHPSTQQNESKPSEAEPAKSTLDSIGNTLKIDDDTWGGRQLHKDGKDVFVAEIGGGAIGGGIVFGPPGALAGAIVGTIGAIATDAVFYVADKLEKYAL